MLPPTSSSTWVYRGLSMFGLVRATPLSSDDALRVSGGVTGVAPHAWYQTLFSRDDNSTGQQQQQQPQSESPLFTEEQLTFLMAHITSHIPESRLPQRPQPPKQPSEVDERALEARLITQLEPRLHDFLTKGAATLVATEGPKLVAATTQSVTAKLRTELDPLTQRVQTVEGQLKGVQSHQRAQGTQVTALQSGVTSLIINVTCVEGAHSALSSQVTSLAQQTAANQLATTARLTQVEGKVTQLGNVFTTLEGKHTNLSQKVTPLEGLASALSGVQSTQKGMAEQLTTVKKQGSATAATVTAAQVRITALEKQVSGVIINVTGLEGAHTAPNSQVAGLANLTSATTARLGQVEGKVTKLDASVTAVQGRATKLEKGASEETTAVKKLEAKQTALNTQFASLETLQGTSKLVSTVKSADTHADWKVLGSHDAVSSAANIGDTANVTLPAWVASMSGNAVVDFNWVGIAAPSNRVFIGDVVPLLHDSTSDTAVHTVSTSDQHLDERFEQAWKGAEQIRLARSGFAVFEITAGHSSQLTLQHRSGNNGGVQQFGHVTARIKLTN